MQSYLKLLREIAIQHRNLSVTLIDCIKKAKVLLGSRKTITNVPTANFNSDFKLDELDFEWELLGPNDVVIINDNNAYQSFDCSIYGVPQEDLLEG